MVLGDTSRCHFASFRLDIRQENAFSLHLATLDRKIGLYNLTHGRDLQSLEFLLMLRLSFSH